mgnify:CR=1 FL=1
MGKAVSALRSQEIALERAKKFTRRVKVRCKELGWEFIGVYLVGSRARGDYFVDSDIDLVLVVRGVRNLNVINRLEVLKDLLEPGIDLRVYDVEEWLSEESIWVIELRREAIKLD